MVVLLAVLVGGCRSAPVPALGPPDCRPDPPPTVVSDDARFHALVDWTAARLVEWDVPGAAIAVVEDRSLRHLAGIGVRTRCGGEGVGVDTRFRAGSLSKLFTGMLAAQAAVDGRLDLAAPAGAALGGLTLAPPDSPDDFTVLQLLSHTSGLQSTGLPLACEVDPTALAPTLAALAPEWNQWVPAGELHHYANEGYALAGLAVERAGGAPFAEQAQALFDAAGMEGATYDWERAAAEAPSTGHSFDPATRELVAYRGLDERACVASYPSGGLVASVTDLGRAAEVLLRDGEGWVSEAAWTLVTTEGVTDTSGYGFGLQNTSYRGWPGRMHHGSVGGWLAMLWTVPSEGLGVVVLVNADHAVTDPPEPWSKPTQRIMARALDTFLGLWPEERASTVRPTAEWARFAGTYRSAFALGEVRVGFDGETLLLRRPDEVRPLRPYSADSFLAPYRKSDGRLGWEGVSFVDGADGEVRWLVTGEGIAERAP